MFKFSVADPLDVAIADSLADEEPAPRLRGLEAHTALGGISAKKNVNTVTQAQRQHHEASAPHALTVPGEARCFFCKKTPQDISVT